MASLLPSDLYSGVYKSIVADPQAVRLQREQEARSQAERGELLRKQAQQAELEKVLGGVQQGDPQALSRFMQLDPKGAMEYQEAQDKRNKEKAWEETFGKFLGVQNEFGPKPLPEQNPFFQQLLGQDPARAKTVQEVMTPKVPESPKIGSFEDYVFRSFGPNPTPQQYEQARGKWESLSKAPNTTITVGGQKIPDNVINASLKALEESNAMQEQVQDIQNFLNLAEVTPTGFTSPMTLGVKSLLADFGWNVDDKVPAQQALKGFQNQFALKLRNPESGFGLTGNTSDKDVRFLKDAVAGLEKTPQANKAILLTLLAKQRRERDLKSLYAQHLSSGDPIGDWVKKRKDFIESNPFFTPEEESFFKNAKMMSKPFGVIKKSSRDRDIADSVYGE